MTITSPAPIAIAIPTRHTSAEQHMRIAQITVDGDRSNEAIRFMANQLANVVDGIDARTLSYPAASGYLASLAADLLALLMVEHGIPLAVDDAPAVAA